MYLVVNLRVKKYPAHFAGRSGGCLRDYVR